MNEIIIYSDIGPDFFGEGITDAWVKDKLDEMKDAEEITVRINSVGGDVFHGFAIHNLLKEHPAKITVKVDGLAASAASVIVMAGDSINMADNAMMMIHNPWTIAIGDSAEMAKTAERLDKVKSSIVKTYENRTGLSGEEISNMMDEETWLTTAEAIDRGFADKQDEQTADIKNQSRPWIKNMPKVEEPELKLEPIEPEIKPEHEETVAAAPMKIAAKLRLLEI
jgi:ATP-dependent protease ClpP protease subunit